MRLFKYIFALSCLFFQMNMTFAACDFTTSDAVVIIPSGTHNSAAGFTQLYVLTDFNGNIIATNTTGDFGIQNFGSYNAYSINYDDANSPTIPGVGVNISSINTGCFDISLALPLTVCNTSVDSVCEGSGNDIVIAMNPNYNFATDYNQTMVVVDNATGIIVSIKTLDILTGTVSYTTDAVTGELTLGDYTIYAVNYQNPETLASIGLLLGNAWSGVFGGACAVSSGGDLIQVTLCCPTITYNLDSTDLSCFNDFSGVINVANVNGGNIPYTYSIDGGVSFQDSTNFTTLDTGLYTIIVKDFSNCTDTGQVYVNQPTALTLDLTVDSVICFGENNGEIIAIPSGGTVPYTYSWTSSINTDSIESNLLAGMDTLTVTDDNGCVVDSVVEVFEPTELIYSSVIAGANCGVSDGQINFDITGGIAPYQYSIDNGLNFQSVDSFPNIGAATYDVLIKDASNCQIITQENVLNIGAPVIDSLFVINPLCNGGTGQINIYASGGTGVIEYNIEGGVNQTNNDFSNLAVATYTVNIEDGNNCTLDSVVTIIEPSLLDVTLIITDVTCFGFNDGSILADVSGGTTPYLYSWTSSNNTDSLETNLVAGIDTLTITDDNGCTLESVGTIGEPDDFTVGILIVDSIICFGDNDAELSAFVSPNPNDYQYDWISPIVSNGAILSNLGPEDYTVVATNNLTGCTDTNLITVIEPIALTLALDSNQTICINQNATLTGNSTGGTGALIYNWDNGLNNLTTQNVTPILTTVYNLYVTDVKGCSTDTLSAVVTVRDTLSVTAFNDAVICNGDTVDVSSIAAGGDGNYNYLWDNAVSTSQFTDTPQNDINYVITLTDGCGTPAVYDTVKVVVNQIPVASFNRDEIEGCYPVASAYFANAVDNVNNQYTWVLSNGEVVSNNDSLVNNFETPGCYDLTLHVSGLNGCSSNTTLINAVCVYDYPQADFDFNLNDEEFNSTTVFFDNQSIDADLNFWNFGGFGNSTEINPEFNFPDSDSIAIYQVCLDVVSINGCPSTHCEPVTIINDDLFYIPNTFTPDGDGLNDIFIPILTGYDHLSYEFLIFNRWGELLFKTEDMEQGWDGVYKGTLVQQDVYVWKINAKKLKTSEIENYIGHVNVIK